MLHALAARALIMITDFNITPKEAIAWVARKLPKGLNWWYQWQIHLLVQAERYHTY